MGVVSNKSRIHVTMWSGWLLVLLSCLVIALSVPRASTITDVDFRRPSVPPKRRPAKQYAISLPEQAADSQTRPGDSLLVTLVNGSLIHLQLETGSALVSSASIYFSNAANRCCSLFLERESDDNCVCPLSDSLFVS